MELTAVLEKEDEMYIEKCTEIGTVSQRESIEEAIENLKETTELYLEEFLVKRRSRPILTTFEITIPNVKAQENFWKRMSKNSV